MSSGCENQTGFGLKKVNNLKVKVILPREKVRKKRIKNFEMFPNPYSNVISVAARMSGKSNVMGNIVLAAASTKTRVLLFAGSIWTDKTFKKVGKKLRKKKIAVDAYDSIKTGEGGEVFRSFIADLREKDKQRQAKNGGFFGDEEDDENSQDEDLYSEDDQVGEGKHDPGYEPIYFTEEEEIAAKKKAMSREKEKKAGRKRGTKEYAKYIVVIDDLAGEIKYNPDLEYLYKTGRHWKIMVITNIQWTADVSAGSRRNQDYWILFKGLQKEALETIKRDADIGLDLDKFIAVYDMAVAGSYSFLYYDTKKGVFRRNFDQEIIIPKTTGK